MNAARQPLKLARPDIADGEVGRYSEADEVFGRERRPRRPMGIELI
jgi:hypothetical protein